MGTQPSLTDLTRVFARIGLLSFGGPAAQISLMHRELVDTRGWLDEARFLNALSFAMLLPGPEAMQLATYAGWRLHSVIGGLIAGLLFVLPGAIVVAGLSVIYAYFGSVPLVAAAFLGVQATVVVIVLQALLRISTRALKRGMDWVIGVAAFVGIFAFVVPFPAIIAVAGLVGAMLPTMAGEYQPTPSAKRARTAPAVLICLFAWAAPIVVLYIMNADLLFDIAIFFSKLAVVTFGGAYAVLAYMTQEVVSDFGWITTEDMLIGLGLAETTPGPLILVTEFVGFLAGFKEGGLGLGLLAALVTLWVTFVPCFLWIFAGAPYLEALTGQPHLKGALDGVTAAVVGVMLNLAIWFAVHVFFNEVAQSAIGPASLPVPTLDSFDPIAVGFAIGAAILLLFFKVDLLRVLVLATLAGLAIGALGLT